jgi:hypothetical protein
MKRNELVDGYAAWLEQYVWQWFGTLTFRGFPPLTKAKQMFRMWIGELKLQNGTPQFASFCAKEGGATGENIHFHVLIGGLRDRSQRLPWVGRWWELAGDAQISYFRKNENAIRYLLKTITIDGDFDVALDFPPAPQKMPPPRLSR